ncbi:hypothetical protein CMI48_02635 [Candidatus Pacearchaeota archaeon]|nr:hypothetical protein [Candidatus Pacearchaeota archaeon]
MAKGAAIKFTSYEQSVPQILDLLKLPYELKKHPKIILKPTLTEDPKTSTPAALVEATLKYLLDQKNPVAEIFIAEGADGFHTEELFRDQGYTALAEKYGVGLIDLNTAETEEKEHHEFLRFDSIQFPTLLKDSFLITLPKLAQDPELELQGALSSTLGLFPADHYRGFLAANKSKIRKWPAKYAIHDITRCKMPDLALLDSTDHGLLVAGKPLAVDKKAAQLSGLIWKDIGYLKMMDEAEQEEAPQIQKA